MQVQIGDLRVVEIAVDHLIHARALHHVGVHHHCAVVESAYRQQSDSERIGHLVHGWTGFNGVFTYVDGVPRPIRTGHAQVFVIEQQHRITDGRIAQTDPAWESRVTVGDASYDALGGQAWLRQAKHGHKLRDRQAGDPEIHLCALLDADAHRLAAAALSRAPILAIEY